MPTPDELMALIAQVEVDAIRAQFDISDDLLGTAWYLHGVTAAAPGTSLYDPERRRAAFAVSAHILDLGLADTSRPRDLRLALAFGAQIGYRRCEQDPNAAAVFRRVSDLLIVDGSLASHVDTLALEAGVAFLGMQRQRLSESLRAWRRQLRELRQLSGLSDFRNTIFGPAEAVVEAVHHLTVYLTRGDAATVERARHLLTDVVTHVAGDSDLRARWVASHLLDIVDDLAHASLHQLLPPDAPAALAHAFALSDPAVMGLWPPQRELLQRPVEHPLAVSTRRMLISVPTSAGKTLMAQLVICAHLTADRSRVIYVSPLRALGREMRQSLLARLRILGHRLGDDLPDFPTPSAGLSGADVEIVTPERLMHSLRNDPESALDGVGLIVIDEAHHMAHAERGFLLESLVTFCQLHPAAPRLILLSAAVGNRAALARWLNPDGGDDSSEIIFSSTWRGPRRLHGLLSPELLTDQLKRTTRPRRKNIVRPYEAAIPMALRLSVRPTPTAQITHFTTPPDQPVGTRVYAERTPGDTSQRVDGKNTPDYHIFAAGAAILSAGGSVLMVCQTRRAARDTAMAVTRHLSDLDSAAPVAQFIADTLGHQHPLAQCARKGVGYHHAQLPSDVRHAVEDALRGEQLRIVCCTSTLTDGVNLPVHTVIVTADVDDGRSPFSTAGRPQMPPAQLLNAVGRAGRAGRESEGWILLARHRPPRTNDFDLLNPDDERLHVLSALGTEKALGALADAEALIASTADAIFQLASNHAADFASYIWFALDALSHLPTLTTQSPLAAAERLLCMSQLPPEIRSRWLRFAAAIAEQYEVTEPGARRRWTTPGTSIGTARTIDALAEALSAALISEQHTQREQTSTYELTLDDTLDFFARHDAYGSLLELPEAKGAWKFPSNTAGDVPIADAVTGWVSGTSIPALAASWLPDADAEWALEQTVENISQCFEHYLSWTLGALTNLINARLVQAGATFQLSATAAWHLRHGVDTPQALALLNAGITSRRLAHHIGREARAHQINIADLRDWLTVIGLDGWRTRFNANTYEAADLLEYVRRPRPSLISDLISQGQVAVTVTPLTSADRLPCEISHAPGTQPAPLIVTSGDAAAAAIPADRHLDVAAILDSGLEFTVTLTSDQLSFQLFQ